MIDELFDFLSQFAHHPIDSPDISDENLYPNEDLPPSETHPSHQIHFGNGWACQYCSCQQYTGIAHSGYFCACSHSFDTHS